MNQGFLIKSLLKKLGIVAMLF